MAKDKVVTSTLVIKGVGDGELLNDLATELVHQEVIFKRNHCKTFVEDFHMHIIDVIFYLESACL